MADPLAQVTNDVAPPTLNFFDEAQAQNIMSRYADAKGVFEARSAAQQFRQGEEQSRMAAEREKREALKFERDRLLDTREDREYQDKQDVRSKRSGLYRDVMKLNTEDADYDNKVIGFLSTLPPALQEDETLLNILRAQREDADEYQKNQLETKKAETAQKYRLDTIKKRAEFDKDLAYLSDEDRSQAPVDPETGEPDLTWLRQKAVQRKQEAGVKDYAEKTAIRTKATKDILSIRADDAEEKALHDETKNVYIKDTAAFPDRIEMLRQSKLEKGKPLSDVALEGVYPSEFRAAKEWEKDKWENTVLEAKDYPDIESYANPEGANLSRKSQHARRRVWTFAHRFGDGAEKPDVPATAPVTADKFTVGKQYRDGNGNVATYKGNGKFE